MAKKTDTINIKVTTETAVARKGIADLIKRLGQLEKQASRAGAAMNKTSLVQKRAAHSMVADRIYQKTTGHLRTLRAELTQTHQWYVRSERAYNIGYRGLLKLSSGFLKVVQASRSALPALKNFRRDYKALQSSMKEASNFEAYQKKYQPMKLPRNQLEYFRRMKDAYRKHIANVRKFNADLAIAQAKASPLAKLAVNAVEFGRKVRTALDPVRKLTTSIRDLGQSAGKRMFRGMQARLNTVSQMLARFRKQSEVTAAGISVYGMGGQELIQGTGRRYSGVVSATPPRSEAPARGVASGAQRSINAANRAAVQFRRSMKAATVGVRQFFQAFRSFDPSAMLQNLVSLPNRISFAFWKLNNMFWLVRRAATGVSSVIKGLTAGFADQIETAEEYHRMRLPINMLKQLRVVARMTDVSMSEIQVIVKNMNRSLDRAAKEGVTRYSKALQMIGVDMAEVRQGTVDAFEVMKKLGVFMRQNQGRPIATEIMSVLGGKGGFRGAPVFSFLARDDFGQLTAAVSLLGLELGDTATEFKEAVSTAHEIKIAYGLVTTVFDGMINQLNLGMGPAVLSAMNLLKSLVLTIRLGGQAVGGEAGYFQTFGRILGQDFYAATTKASSRLAEFLTQIRRVDSSGNMDMGAFREAVISLTSDIGEVLGEWSAWAGFKMAEIGVPLGVSFAKGFIEGIKTHLVDNPAAQVFIGAVGGYSLGAITKGAINLGAGGAAKGAAAGAAAGAVGGQMVLPGMEKYLGGLAPKAGTGAMLGRGAMKVVANKLLSTLMGGLLVPLVIEGLNAIDKYGGGVSGISGTVVRGGEVVGRFIGDVIIDMFVGLPAMLGGALLGGTTVVVAIASGIVGAIVGVFKSIWDRVIDQIYQYLPSSWQSGIDQLERGSVRETPGGRGSNRRGRGTRYIPVQGPLEEKDSARLERIERRLLAENPAKYATPAFEATATSQRMRSRQREMAGRAQGASLRRDALAEVQKEKRAAQERIEANQRAAKSLQNFSDASYKLQIRDIDVAEERARKIADADDRKMRLEELGFQRQLAGITAFQISLASLNGTVEENRDSQKDVAADFEAFEKHIADTGIETSKYNTELESLRDAIQNYKDTGEGIEEVETALTHLTHASNEHKDEVDAATQSAKAFSIALQDAQKLEDVLDSAQMWTLRAYQEMGNLSTFTPQGANAAGKLMKMRPQGLDPADVESAMASQYVDISIKNLIKAEEEMRRLQEASIALGGSYEELRASGFTLAEAQKIVTERTKNQTTAKVLNRLAGATAARGNVQDAATLRDLANATAALTIEEEKARLTRERRRESARAETGRLTELFQIDVRSIMENLDRVETEILRRQAGIKDQEVKLEIAKQVRLKELQREWTNDIKQSGEFINSVIDKSLDALFEGGDFDFGEMFLNVGKDKLKGTWSTILKDKLEFLDRPIKKNFLEIGAAWIKGMGDAGAEGMEAMGDSATNALKDQESGGIGGFFKGLLSSLGLTGETGEGKGEVSDEVDKQSEEWQKWHNSAGKTNDLLARIGQSIDSGFGNLGTTVENSAQRICGCQKGGGGGVPSQGDKVGDTVGQFSGLPDYAKTGGTTTAGGGMPSNFAADDGMPSNFNASSGTFNLAESGGVLLEGVNLAGDGAMAGNIASGGSDIASGFDWSSMMGGFGGGGGGMGGGGMGGGAMGAVTGAIEGGLAAYTTSQIYGEMWIDQGSSGFASRGDADLMESFAAGIGMWYEEDLLESIQRQATIQATVVGAIGGAVIGFFTQGQGGFSEMFGQIVGMQQAMHGKLIAGDISEEELRSGDISFSGGTWAHDPIGTLFYQWFMNIPSWDEIMRLAFENFFTATDAGNTMRKMMGGLDTGEGGRAERTESGYLAWNPDEYDARGYSTSGGRQLLNQRQMDATAGRALFITGRMAQDPKYPGDATILGEDSAEMLQKQYNQFLKQAQKKGMSQREAEKWVNAQMRALFDEIGLNLAEAIFNAFSTQSQAISILGGGFDIDYKQLYELVATGGRGSRRVPAGTEEYMRGFNLPYIEQYSGRPGNMDLMGGYDPEAGTIWGLGPTEFQQKARDEGWWDEGFTTSMGGNPEQLFERIGQNLWEAGQALDQTFGDQLPKGIRGAEMLLLSFVQNGEALINSADHSYMEMLTDMGRSEEETKALLAKLAVEGWEIDREKLEEIVPAAVNSSAIMQKAIRELIDTASIFENRWRQALAVIARETIAVVKAIWEETIFQGPVAAAVMPVTLFLEETNTKLENQEFDYEDLMDPQWTEDLISATRQSSENLALLGPQLRAALAAWLEIEDKQLEVLGLPTRAQAPLLDGYKTLFQGITGTFVEAWRAMKYKLGEIFMEMFDRFINLDLDEQMKTVFEPITKLFNEAEQIELLFGADWAAAYTQDQLPVALDQSLENLEEMKPELEGRFKQMKAIRRWLMDNGFIPDPAVEAAKKALGEVFDMKDEMDGFMDDLKNFRQLLGATIRKTFKSALLSSAEPMFRQLLAPIQNAAEEIGKLDWGTDPDAALKFWYIMNVGLAQFLENLNSPEFIEGMKQLIGAMEKADKILIEAGLMPDPAVEEWYNALAAWSDALSASFEQGIINGLQNAVNNPAWANLSREEVWEQISRDLERQVFSAVLKGIIEASIAASALAPAFAMLGALIGIGVSVGFTAALLSSIEYVIGTIFTELDKILTWLEPIIQPWLSRAFDTSDQPQVEEEKEDQWVVGLEQQAESAFATGFEAFVNDPTMTTGQLFDNIAADLKRQMYQSVITGILEAAIATSALGGLFKELGELISLGFAEGFSKGLIGTIIETVDAIGVALEEIFQVVLPLISPLLDAAYLNVAEDVATSAEKTSKDIQTATKASCELDYRYAEARAGAAVLSALGREGRVIGGVGIGDKPLTFIPRQQQEQRDQDGRRRDTGKPRAEPGDAENRIDDDTDPTTDPVPDGGGPYPPDPEPKQPDILDPGTVPPGVPPELDPKPKTILDFLDNYSTKTPEEREKMWDPDEYKEKYGLRTRMDTPLLPIDPADLPTNMEEEWGSFGKWFVPRNYMFWEGMKDYVGEGMTMDDWLKVFTGQVPGVSAENFAQSAVSWGWWGRGNPSAEDFMFAQEIEQNTWFDNLFDVMKMAGWPRQVEMAEGGIVGLPGMRPVNAIVGEAGPEAIIPLSRIDEISDTIGTGLGGTSSSELAGINEKLELVAEAMAQLASVMSEQTIETEVKLDTKTLAKGLSKVSRGLRKGGAVILPSDTVR